MKARQIHVYGRPLITQGIGSKTPCVSCSVMLTTWAIARQAPLSMEFSRQEYWGG